MTDRPPVTPVAPAVPDTVATDTPSAGPTPPPVGRRRFLGTAGAVAAGAATLPAGAWAQTPPAGAGATTPAAPDPSAGGSVAGPAPTGNVHVFFSEAEAEFVAAAVERLYPTDPQWPGAVQLGVVDYIDRQLAGAFGVGERMYLRGPWAAGTPQQGYQLPYTPAQLYRVAIETIGRRIAEAHDGRPFDRLSGPEQDRVLRQMEAGQLDTPEVPSAVFFETLLANTIEGVFSDPIYGGNRDMMAWRMVGFPGAYAQFVELVDEHGMVYDRAPMSIAQKAAEPGHGHGQGHGHGHGAPPARRG